MVEREGVDGEDRALENHNHQGGNLETHGKVDVMRGMTRHYTNSESTTGLIFRLRTAPKSASHR